MNRNQTERNVYRARTKSWDFGPKSHDCRKCGRSTCPPKGLTVCPTKDKTCSKCNKKGHFASVCYSRNRLPPQQYLSDSKRKSNDQIIKQARSVTKTNTCDRPAPKIAITLRDANTKDLIGSFEATPDTGAEATLARIDILEKMCLDVDTLLHPPSKVLVAANNGQELDCVGTLRCVIHYCDRQCVENVYICANIESFWLAWYTCISLAILPCDYPRPIDCSPKKSMLQGQITACS